MTTENYLTASEAKAISTFTLSADSKRELEGILASVKETASKGGRMVYKPFCVQESVFLKLVSLGYDLHTGGEPSSISGFTQVSW